MQLLLLNCHKDKSKEKARAKTKEKTTKKQKKTNDYRFSITICCYFGALFFAFWLDLSKKYLTVPLKINQNNSHCKESNPIKVYKELSKLIWSCLLCLKRNDGSVGLSTQDPWYIENFSSGVCSLWIDDSGTVLERLIRG